MPTSSPAPASPSLPRVKISQLLLSIFYINFTFPFHHSFPFYPGIHHISDGVFLSSAEALADMVTEEDLAVGRSQSYINRKHKISETKQVIYSVQALPSPLQHPRDFRADCKEGVYCNYCLSIKEEKISPQIQVAEEAYAENTASTYPEPEDKEAFIRTHLYDYNYDKVTPSLHC